MVRTFEGHTVPNYPMSARRMSCDPGVRVFAWGADGSTPLHWAASRDGSAVVDELVRAGAALETKSACAQAARIAAPRPRRATAQQGNRGSVWSSCGLDSSKTQWCQQCSTVFQRYTPGGRGEACRMMALHAEAQCSS